MVDRCTKEVNCAEGGAGLQLKWGKSALHIGRSFAPSGSVWMDTVPSELHLQACECSYTASTHAQDRLWINWLSVTASRRLGLRRPTRATLRRSVGSISTTEMALHY